MDKVRKAKAVDRLFGSSPGTVVMTDPNRRVRVFDSWQEAKAWMERWHSDLLFYWPSRKPRNYSALSYPDGGRRRYKQVWIMGFSLEVY